jgi:alkanesulfonate monooxygenase SsuD/methylene tetrahydromethanopterin reductase-like flavin-dependent oxidoreductase (luciferase family)
VLGLGTGDPIDRPEHEAFGFPSLSKSERRVHLAETIRALKALFAGEGWEGGEFVPEIAGPLAPGPAAPNGPPIWIGGQADEVVALAGRLADGWNGWGLSPEAFAEKAGVLSEAAAAAGRAAEPTWAGIVLVGADDTEADELLVRRRSRGMPDEGVWTGGAERCADRLGELAGAGATWAVLVPAGPPDRVELIAERVLPRLHP